MNPSQLKFRELNHLSDISNYANALETLQSDSLRYLYIRSSRLSPLLDEQVCLDLLSSFCRHSRHRFIYILLDEPRLLLKDDSRVLALSRRLSDKILIKTYAGDIIEPTDTWIMSDQQAVMFIPADTTIEGFVTHSDPANQQQLKHQFIADWQRASQCSDIRLLSGI